MPRPKKDAPQAEEQIEVIERFDPAEQAEIDGDPSFSFRLKKDEEGLPPDLVAVWAHTSDVNSYKGKGWRNATGADGVQFLCEREVGEETVIQEADHILLVRDKGKHQRIYDAERARSRKTRAAILKGARGEVFVNPPADGPRAMERR